jgi:hypothetical protein
MCASSCTVGDGECKTRQKTCIQEGSSPMAATTGKNGKIEDVILIRQQVSWRLVLVSVCIQHYIALHVTAVGTVIDGWTQWAARRIPAAERELECDGCCLAGRVPRTDYFSDAPTPSPSSTQASLLPPPSAIALTMIYSSSFVSRGLVTHNCSSL